MSLVLVPLSVKDALVYVEQHHRTHGKPHSAMWAVGCAIDAEDVVRGVAIVGLPVARMLNDGYTAEVVRCCTDGTRNACSFLYSACWRAARALGYVKLVTYTLEHESGASLRAAGWRIVAKTRGGSWSRAARPRVDSHPTQKKLRWELTTM